MATKRQPSLILTRIRQFGWGLLIVLLVTEAVLVFVATRQDGSTDRSEPASQAQRPDDDPPAAEPEAAALAAEADPQPPTARTITPPPVVVPPPVNVPDPTIGGRSIFEGGGGGGGRPRTDEEQEAEAERQRLLEEAVRALQEQGEIVETHQAPAPSAPSDKVEPVIDDRLEAAQIRLAVADADLAAYKKDNQRIAEYVALQNKISLYEKNQANERIAQLLKEARSDLKALGNVSENQVDQYKLQLEDLRREQRNARSALKALTAGR